MKFNWNLQKILEIRRKQEAALKAELFEIVQGQMKIKQQIMLCQMQIRNAAGNLSEASISVDAGQRSDFLKFAFGLNKTLEGLNKQLDETEKLRKQKIKENVQMRKARKALENLREKAFDDFQQSVNKAEQAFLDDVSSVRQSRQRLGLA